MVLVRVITNLFVSVDWLADNLVWGDLRRPNSQRD
jgi:hypothetical protein